MSDPVQNLSWDDLRIIRAVGKSGALAPAAEMLGVNISTIARRLTKVEAVLGVALFERRRTGYLLTPQGEEITTLADRVELDIVSVTRRVSGHTHDHTGDLRVTTSDSLLFHFLTPIIADFHAAHTGIRVEVIVGNAALNLARGESDIALRATENPPENLFGKKVATIAWAPYASARSPQKADADPEGGGLFDGRWVSYGGKLGALKALRFVEDRVPPENIAYRTDSVAGAAEGIAAGLGVGYLPCMLGDIRPDLVRAGPIEPQLDDQLWLLTHPDIRKSGRVSAFMTFCAEAIGRRRPLIEGSLASAPQDPG